MLILSDNLAADWLSTYLDAVGECISRLEAACEGPARAAGLLYANDGKRATIFAQFAYTDVLLACLGTATTIIVLTWTAIPEGESFSPKNGRYLPAGSWTSAIIVLLFASGLCLFLWITVFKTGSFFSGVKQHCVEYSGFLFSRHRHCLSMADNTFPETIARLGWGMTVAAVGSSALCSWAISAVRTAFRKSVFRADRRR